jgi:hypothetical protein
MKSIKKLLRTSTRLESSTKSEITSEERTRWDSWISRMANLIISKGHDRHRSRFLLWLQNAEIANPYSFHEIYPREGSKLGGLQRAPATTSLPSAEAMHATFPRAESIVGNTLSEA